MQFQAPVVPGLDAQAQSLLDTLWRQWAAKQPRNIERQLYLDAKNKLKNLDVSLPPSLVDKLEVVMGWPEKAVFEMANRVVLDTVGFGDGRDSFGLKEMLRRNRFAVEFPQTVVDSLSHSVSFGTVTPGGAGEPPALIMFHSAMWATGIWDRRRRALSGGLVINDADALGNPTRFTFLTDWWVATVEQYPSGGWSVTHRWDHNLGRTPMQMFPYRPSLNRPFGRARIDRTVMSLTDRAIRAESRLEVHSELFSMMRLYLLGADKDTFKDKAGNQIPLWSFYAGMLNTLSKDEDGDVPKLEKVTAESPEPHIAVARHLVSRFSGHTGVPMSSLGVSTDNPESADAKTQAREDIVKDAEMQHVIYGHELAQLLETAVMVQEGMSERPAEFDDLSFVWRRPDRITLAGQSDAGSKQVAAVPDLAETTVGLELLGLDRSQIERFQSERRRSQARGLLDEVLARRTQPVAGEVVEEAE